MSLSGIIGIMGFIGIAIIILLCIVAIGGVYFAQKYLLKKFKIGDLPKVNINPLNSLNIIKKYAFDKDAIQQNGIHAQAKIIDFTKRGQLNYQPTYIMELEVRIPGKPHYIIKDSFVMHTSTEVNLRKGALIDITVDVNDPQKAILDFDEGTDSEKNYTVLVNKAEEYEAVGNIAGGEIKNGIPAQAKIISIVPIENKKDTYQVAYDVSTDNFTTSNSITKEVALPVYAISLIEVGNIYPCEIDPKNKKRIVIKTDPQTFIRPA